MAKIDELKLEVVGLETEVSELRLAIDEREARDTQVEHDLRQLMGEQATEIGRLTALLGAAPTDTQIQEVIDGLKSINAGLNAAADDVSVADES